MSSLAVFSACVVFALQSGASAPAPAPDATASLVARVALIGASASAGYNVHVSLCEALEAQIAVKHSAPVSFAEEAFFIDPPSIGEAQVARAAAIAPTLVVAADFLFWFGYGETSDETERLDNLDTGLELLDELKCPLIVSHFPDMTPAVGKMLLATQVPKKETLGKLNARLDAWASARGHVGFVAMPEFIDKLRSGFDLKIGGIDLKGADAKKRMMQRDDLHPTAEGLGVLARLCIDAACQPSIGAKPTDFKLELAPILESLRKLDDARAGSLRIDLGGGQPPPKPKEGGGKSEAPERVLRIPTVSGATR